MTAMVITITNLLITMAILPSSRRPKAPSARAFKATTAWHVATLSNNELGGHKMEISWENHGEINCKWRFHGYLMGSNGISWNINGSVVFLPIDGFNGKPCFFILDGCTLGRIFHVRGKGWSANYLAVCPPHVLATSRTRLCHQRTTWLTRMPCSRT